MAGKITLKQIAQHLGVAVSTVSKALKNSNEISQETKDRILKYVNEVHYTPNHLAINLRQQKTMTIGIIVPELVHHFFSRVISGVENQAGRYNYNVLISLSNDELDKERKITEMLTNGYVDGLLVSVAKESFEKQQFDHFEKLLSQKFPLVFFDRAPINLPVSKVIIDDVAGGYQATRHLIEQGARRIAILTTPRHISIGADREKGYRKALLEADMSIDESLILRIDESQSIRDQIKKLFNYPLRPDAIFAVNENYASFALKEAYNRSLKVPDDLLIVGFTDGFISKATIPSLTTIAQHGFEMGQKAVDILMEQIESGKYFEGQIVNIIPTNLIIRESSNQQLHRPLLK
ncbi:MAG TPA: LacI family transcriptional regulator [Flavobacteriales bacterium]|nr:LacI family transcriptional regulator [Flavobacteriales bacterium]